MGCPAEGLEKNTTVECDNKWSAYVFKLSVPILHDGNLISVIRGSDYAIYPPFNFTSQSGHETDPQVAYLPEGFSETSFFRYIDLKKLGRTSLNVEWRFARSLRSSEKLCYSTGIRIDVIGDHIKALKLVRRFLSGVRSRTYQWWLLSQINRFDLGIKLYSRLNELHNYVYFGDRIEKLGPYSIRSVDSKMILTGIELPLSKPLWDWMATCSDNAVEPDPPGTLFCDALEKFLRALPVQSAS